MNPTKLLTDCFNDLVKHASAAKALEDSMPNPPVGRTLVIAIGKAAAAMAAAFERQWPDDATLSGIALTRYGHGEPCDRIEVVEASHPVPDGVGHETAKRIVSEVKALGPDDLFVCLISGGGSALLSLPVAAITLAEKQKLNRQLLAAGLPIDKMNCVRKHVSAVKGGRLAELAHPAPVHTVAISDVPGNSLSVIASGPTVPDTSTREQAAEIANTLPGLLPSIEQWLRSPSAETPKSLPQHPATQAMVTITPESAFEALSHDLNTQDFDVHYLGADIEGEASNVAKDHAAIVLKLAKQGNDCPTVILSGGETTVTLPPTQPHGKGGRNCEYLLALMIELQGHEGIYAIACDTDGIDGSEDNAGALITPASWSQAQGLGLDPQAFLDAHDSYSLFEKLDALIKPGPTRTNINDFRAILVMPRNQNERTQPS